jgi:hypothetical protein
VKRYFFFLLLLTTVSCQRDKAEADGNDVLSRDQMVIILTDLHLVEAQAGSSGLNYDSTLILYNELERQVLAKHNADTGLYRRSYRYYSENVADLDMIYARVIDSLSVRETTLEMP